MLKILLAFIISMSSCSSVLAANTSLFVEIHSSKVANIYYEVLYQQQRLEKDIVFELIDKQGNVIDQIKTSNSVLYKENIPFGSYVLKPLDQKYKKLTPMIIDQTYLLTHHILKPLELGEPAPLKTGDDYNIHTYFFLFYLSFFFLTWIRKGVLNDD